MSGELSPRFKKYDDIADFHVRLSGKGWFECGQAVSKLDTPTLMNNSLQESFDQANLVDAVSWVSPNRSGRRCQRQDNFHQRTDLYLDESDRTCVRFNNALDDCEANSCPTVLTASPFI